MRRIAIRIASVLAIFAAVVACSREGRADASAASASGSTQLFREAAAVTAQSGPEASVPNQFTLAPLIERLKPAVVNISTTTIVKNPHRFGGGRNPRGGAPGQDPFNDFFDRFFGGRPPPQMPEEQRGQSLGSGFVLNAEGFILTNAHVVENATDIKVRLNDDREFTAKLVGRDPLTDVALIRLNNPPKNLPTVVLGDSDVLRQGDFVLALGSPFGLRETATFGIVSAKHRSRIGAGTGTYDDYIQTDAAINPGNSGGPLLNMKGEVIGINTAILAPQGTFIGVGFAVPINLAKSILPQLREKGKVVRGYVGVTVGDVTPDLASAFNFPANTQGALVQSVVPSGPAAKAGVKPGDLIVSVNGKPVTTMGDVTRMVALVQPGQKVTLGIVRNGQKQELSFPVEKRPTEAALARRGGLEGEGEGDEGGEQQPAEGAKAQKLGVSLAPLTQDLAQQLGIQGVDRGVVVTNVLPDGPAAGAGIDRGDVIVEFNRQPVAKPEEIAQALGKMHEGQMALLRIRRGDSAFFVPVPVGGRK